MKTIAGLLLLLATAAHSVAAPEIAVAIRYLQAEGVSHSQLYLFREDGKLLRQLTHEKTGQVQSPVFAPDGETVVFEIAKQKETEYWSVEPKGGNLRKLDAAPEWYSTAKNSPFFTNAEPIPAYAVKVLGAKIDDADGKYTTPDGKKELVLRTPPDDPDAEDDLPGHGKHFLLRNLKTMESVELGKVQGFLGLYELLYSSEKMNGVFLIDPPLRLAFFGLHLNSTDGDTVFALDLNTPPRLVRLSTNWATPIPLPGEAAFLTLSEPLYVPIPGSEKTANCSCIERWDSKLNKIHYGRDTATVCYGASMYRPGMKPAVIIIAGPNSNI